MFNVLNVKRCSLIRQVWTLIFYQYVPVPFQNLQERQHESKSLLSVLNVKRSSLRKQIWRSILSQFIKELNWNVNTAARQRPTKAILKNTSDYLVRQNHLESNKYLCLKKTVWIVFKRVLNVRRWFGNISTEPDYPPRRRAWRGSLGWLSRWGAGPS